jgi:site-specific DNA-methyltransferase (cytosine-N4-specific)
MVRPKSERPRTAVAHFRLTQQERVEFETAAASKGFASISEYIRFLHRSTLDAENQPSVPTKPDCEPTTLFHQTQYGRMRLGNSLSLLHRELRSNSVDLIMTSPPFGLVRKKSYGNEDAHNYCDWFRPFAEGFKRVLKDSGSLVIDIGGAWKPGTPTRSLYHFQLLIMLCQEYGFHLCLEHFWWNPAKLPTPAEWVNVRRVRVKDAVNCVWWLSRTPWPKANNRRVLAPYSESMHHLLKKGYKAKLRPSGHDISEKFSKNNGGSVPPNLLAIAHTESNGRYQEYCRANDLPIHPARFPSALPEYFVRMLTDKGDLVVDPFGGSCVTGEVCEGLERRWVCCELSKEYLKGARGRFSDLFVNRRMNNAAPYQIYPPCSVPVDEEAVRGISDGGKERPSTGVASQGGEERGFTMVAANAVAQL